MNDTELTIQSRDAWINRCAELTDALREMVRVTDNSTNLFVSAARRDAQRVIERCAP